MEGCSKSCGSFSRMASRMSSIPCFSLALTNNGFSPNSCSIKEEISLRMSALFRIRMTGMFLAFNCCIQAASTCRLVSSHRSKAMSVRSMAFNVRSIRISPSVPSSSNPGVSMITQGPMPWISMALLTGSVVVPGMSLTRAVS